MGNLSNFEGGHKVKPEQIEKMSFEELEVLANTNKCSLVMDYIENMPVFEERKELFEKIYKSNELFKRFWDDAKIVMNSTLRDEIKEKLGKENV